MNATINTYDDYLYAISKLFKEYEEMYRNCTDSFSEMIKRGYAVPEHINLNGIEVLICGINPSYPKLKNTFFEEIKYPKFSTTIEDNHRYWKNMRESILYGVPLKNVEHIDLFALRESDQNKLKKSIDDSNKMNFMVKNLWLTQQIIELMSPKLIIVANKAQWGYWGLLENMYWMGYKFKQEPVKAYSEKMKLLEIEGLKDSIFDKDKNNEVGPIGRVNMNFETKLIGTKVLFTLFQTGKYKCKESEKIQPGMIKEILEKYC